MYERSLHDPPVEDAAGPPDNGPELARAVRDGLVEAATRAVLLAAALVGFALLFHELVTLIAVGIATIVIAIALSAVAAPLERRGVPRPLGALLALLGLLAGIAGLLVALVPPLVAEIEDFVDRLPQIVDSLAERLAGAAGTEAGESLQRSAERILDDPAPLLGPLAQVGLGVIGALSALLVVLITAYYMASRPEPLLRGLVRLAPPSRREWAAHVVDRMRAAWTGWLKGVAVDMAITGALVYAGLTLIGLEFAALFAVLSALLVVVPYFGAIAGGLPPVLLALSQSPELALLTLGVYVLVQQIEGNVLVPLVMARAVRLHPAVIAVGVVAVSQVFGIVGLLVAVPLVSALVILVEELWVAPMERTGVPGTPPEAPAARRLWRRWRRA